MARSLKIIYGKGETVEVTNENKFVTITLPVKGTTVEPYKIKVIVDGVDDNNSFTLNTYDKWYKYKIERIIGSEVNIVFNIGENLDTKTRLGNMEIEHKAAKLSIFVTFVQEPTVYSLVATYDDKDNGGIFSSYPENVYEERIVNVSTEGGSGRWYIKDIEQYNVFGNFFDKGEGKTDITPDEWRAVNKAQRVPYDGVFNYRTTDSQLIVRSFGQIDMSNTHMRYFFRICHMDVNNTNKDDNTTKPYETWQLFVFDGGGNIKTYEDEETEEIKPPTDSYNYTFLVNGKKSHSITFSKEGGEIGISVTSKRNGDEWTDVVYPSTIQWGTITKNKITIPTNKDQSGNWGEERECTVQYVQNRHDGTSETIVLTLIQEGIASDNWVFTVDGNSSDYTYEYVACEGGTYSPTVVSKKGTTDIEWECYCRDNVSWATNSDGVITLQANPYSEERSVVFTFKQGERSPKSPINVTIVQSAKTKGNYPYVVHYYKLGTEISVFGDTIGTGVEGDSITVNAVTVTAYNVYGSVSQSLIISNDATNNVVIFYYIPVSKELTSYYIQYIDNEGNELQKQTIVNGVYIGETITEVEEVSFIGYEYDSENSTHQLTLVSDDKENIWVCRYNKVIKKNTVTIKAGEDVDYDCLFRLYIIKMVEGKVLPENKLDEEVMFDESTDSIKIELVEGELYFLYYVSGNGEGPLSVTHKINTAIKYEIERKEGDYRIINNADGEVVTINAKNMSYVYELDDEKLIVGWEGKLYTDKFAKVYSYGTNGTTKTNVPITDVKIKDGDFINQVKFEGPFNDDENTPYYKIIVGVDENPYDDPRIGHLTIINERGEELTLEVEQVKNGDIILTEFDYIVLTYRWKDYKTSDSTTLSMDFDSVMYFDTPSIGKMYQVCSYYGSNQSLTSVGKIIYDDLRDEDGNYVENPPTETYIDESTKEEKTRTKKGIYAELAFDQLYASSGAGLDCVETQVIYLKELETYKYLKQMKAAGDNILRIQFYGNLYDVSDAEQIPYSDRQVEVSFQTYLGGVMEKNLEQKTMNNSGGILKFNDTIGKYNITSINGVGGRDINTVSTFTHLGVLEYNIKDKTAVFRPSNNLV